jgi:hypothetical protein
LSDSPVSAARVSSLDDSLLMRNYIIYPLSRPPMVDEGLSNLFQCWREVRLCVFAAFRDRPAGGEEIGRRITPPIEASARKGPPRSRLAFPARAGASAPGLRVPPRVMLSKFVNLPQILLLAASSQRFDSTKTTQSPYHVEIAVITGSNLRPAV